MQADIRHQMIALLPRLRRFARGLAGSRDDADDLVQGACERALKSINSWQPGTRLDSWMSRSCTIYGSTSTGAGATKRRSTIPERVAGAEDGRRTAESRLELAEVRAHIAALPEQQRDVLVLVCIEDMSYREAAETLGVPIGTVMSRLARARAALAAALADKEAKPAASQRSRTAMKVTDEMLMALADGELDRETALDVRHAVEADPALARRLAEFERTRTLAKQAFDGVLEEPVPLHLVAALGRGERSPKPAARRVWLPVGAAIAASAAAFALGMVLASGLQGEPEPARCAGARLALESVPSGSSQVVGRRDVRGDRPALPPRTASAAALC